ncbi:MAG: endopeptidase La [Clostridia bacterium]|nr:endopeptidase La [Clostridia bacterium]
MNFVLPLVALRNIVVMPNSTVSFDVLRDTSRRAIDAAMQGTREIILSAQKDPSKEKAAFDDVYSVGTYGKVKQVVKLPGNAVRVMVEGIKRVILISPAMTEPYMTVIAETIEEAKEIPSIENTAMARTLHEVFSEYSKFAKIISADELTKRVFSIKTLGALCDCLIATSMLDFRIKQELLEIDDYFERCEEFVEALGYETEILKLQAELGSKVRQKMDQNQKDYFLREEKRIIEEELGDGVENEAEEYREKIEKLNLPEETREKIFKEVSRFEKMAGSSADTAVSRNYLDTVLELPWNDKTEENLDIEAIKAVLDEDHYGLEKVKERIIEQMAVRKLTGGTKGSLICLSGPPGTGKTSIAKSIARAIGRKYVRISLGGVRDEAEIRGHRKTYIGAMPGRIISAMQTAKVKNPLILLDEIDKMGADIKGDPASALLEVLDYEQNKTFKDHFLDVPYDLSEVMFIATANDIGNIPRPLLDRLEIIEINGYTHFEKQQIIKKYLIPKQAEENGLAGKKFTITDDAVEKICLAYTKEAGVRQAERVVASLMRKIALKFSEGKKQVTVSARTIKSYLGKERYSFDMKNEKEEIGIVRGLAWTAVGGDTLSIEANVMDGTGKIQLTGQLGDVMQESAKTAISYIRSVSDSLGIEKEFYKTKDIHIHIPEGAVPKDGPSAGITMATAVMSALTEKPVRADIAMTGEITLRGRVLEIGGLKEKSIAAMRAGIESVIIPYGNKPDVDEIPEEVRGKINFIPVKNMNEVLKNAIK